MLVSVSQHRRPKARNRDEGWRGWDDYARFYDWENQHTIGRQDVAFWQRFVAGKPGRILELGCGPGRVSVPLARAGVRVVGVDRSPAMLTRARARGRRAKLGATFQLVRADIRALPFVSGAFQIVIAPYGIIQSVLSDRDLVSVLATAARVLEPGGLLGIDVVADVPRWAQYRNRVQLRGRMGRHAHVTLIESVVQQPARHLTRFAQRFVTRIGSRSAEHRFDLQFRTPPLRQLTNHLSRAGFTVDALLGDYAGNRWHKQAEAIIIVARRI